MLARTLHRRGDTASAESAYATALAARPDDLRLRHDYAVLLMQTGRAPEAARQFEAVVAGDPSNLESLLALALSLRATREFERAASVAETATRVQPKEPLGWLILGSAKVESGSARAGESALRRCLELAPDLAEAWHYLGEALQAQQRWHEAAAAYRNAAKEQPGEIFNIAVCAEHAGDLEAARAGYLRTCELYPGRIDCLARLAQVAATLCDFECASEAARRLETRLRDDAGSIPDDVPEAFPLSFLPLSDAARRVALDRYAARIEARAGPRLPATMSPARLDRHRIRLGYLSADFGPHAVGELVRDVFAAHDREVVELHGYSLRSHAGPTAQRIREGFDRFNDCEHLPVDAIADLIRRDGIDVLIDLGGYTHGSRPEVLAKRPASVQLGWLGFIHPQQAPWLDAVLLDAHVQPESAPWPFADRVVRLAGTLFPASPAPAATRDRARFGLPDAPVFASFNNSYKLDDELLAAWAEILRRAPHAHLLVYVPADAQPRFVDHWKRHGGDVMRLRLVDRLSPGEQADRAASCDLFLDAFRYQAGATAIGAVAAGLPVLSRAGDSPLSRLGVSLNRFLDMPELVCGDTAGYIDTAAGLANDPSRLAELRSRLAVRVQTSGLFDPRRAAAGIEAACRAELARRTGLESGPPARHV